MIENLELISCCVEDPRVLASDAREAGLLSQEMASMLENSSDCDIKAKREIILQHIVGAVTINPSLFHRMISVLINQPNVKNLLTILQISGELVYGCFW